MGKSYIETLLEKRILILDGAMGTMIQKYALEEVDYKGKRFKDHGVPLKGNNDILSLTQPQIIEAIHCAYLEVGADIIETNTFNAQSISQSDYGTHHLIYELNYQSAHIARKAADVFSSNDKPRFVAGSIGPTNKSASLPSNVNDASSRAITFNELVDAYSEQVKALIDGGCDVLLLETIFDTLNAKAGLYAIFNVFKEKNKELPVMVSATIESSGRLLSGQTLEAFLTTIACYPVLSVGLNCALGANQMMPFLIELAEKTPFYVSAYPNAGLPDQFGNYTETAEEMAKVVAEFVQKELVNIVGGCCGTTPEHSKLFANQVKDVKPRRIAIQQKISTLAGLEVLKISDESNFINIGERTNVAGSMKFARLIRDKNYEEALSIARQQIENGAQVIDVNLDDSMLDAEEEMEHFIRLLSSDTDISRVPFMIDSSRFAVIEKALQNIQGKAIVNSISLKDGENEFIRKAEKIRNYGAAVVVMAFDEEGQACTYQRKIEICRRAYDLLTRKVGFPPEDIVFDCNVLTIGTGIKEHADYALDFIKAVQWIKSNLPYSKTSGGVSNLSFAFRGNNVLRETMHSIFLFHAIKAGLDMAIVNTGALPFYDYIETELKQAVEDLILNRKSDATECLLSFTHNLTETHTDTKQAAIWRLGNVNERLKYALIKGIPDYLEEDLQIAIQEHTKILSIIEEPLMEAMSEVGDYFGSGRMFLPQVLKSARIMKKAVEILQPLIIKQNEERGWSTKSGKILLATVKGDVHDIGKNIVNIILTCNNFEVIDLGIMVSRDKIMDEAIRQKVDIIGLSGLITPSLDEMIAIAQEMENKKMDIPLIIGGATTSEIHTACKIDTVYSGTVVQIKDASKCVRMVSDLLHRHENGINEKMKLYYKQIREKQTHKLEQQQKLTLNEARKNKFVWKAEEADIIQPKSLGITNMLDIQIENVIPFVDWNLLYKQWQVKGKYPDIKNNPKNGSETAILWNDAQKILKQIIKYKMLTLKSIVGLFEAFSEDESIHVVTRTQDVVTFNFSRNLFQKRENESNVCLSDFIAPKRSGIKDYVGMFAVTADLGTENFHANYDEYEFIMLKTVANMLADALAEFIHHKVRKEWWGYSPKENLPIEDILKGKYRGIRPAPGYSIFPDHIEKEKIFKILDVTKTIGITLTENWSMIPEASVCGFYFAHPQVKYFTLKE